MRLVFTQLNEQVPLFRAVTTQWYPRGNMSVSVEFLVTRMFGSLKEAEVFATTHRNGLPATGDLAILAGEGTDTQTVTLPAAVLADTARHGAELASSASRG